jgi:hypothetical protein
MGVSRQWVVDTLRRLGYPREAEEASRVLPDPVDLEQVQEFGDQHGIYHDDLISRTGGSP